MNKYYITDETYDDLCKTLDNFANSTDDPTKAEYLSDGEWLDVFVTFCKYMERKMRSQLPQINRDRERIHDLASKLYYLIEPWDRDYETIDDIANDMENDPDLIIEYLLDLLEA